jgi:hypothetical protein
MDGWMGGRKEGRKDGWMDGWMEWRAEEVSLVEVLEGTF